MKKAFLGVLAAGVIISAGVTSVLAAGAGRNFVDTDGDSVCDNFVDADENGICDNFVDTDGNGICGSYGMGRGRGRGACRGNACQNGIR